MDAARNHKAEMFEAPPGAAEEIQAALEAASSRECGSKWRDPMRGLDLKEALDLILLADRPDRGLDAMSRSGIMKELLPEVAALVGFGEGIRHKDVWGHTKQVVAKTPARLDLRWAALLHDIGKVKTRRFEPDGKVTFIGHPEVGARIFGDRIARRIPFDEKSKERIRFLIASHLRASSYIESWTDSAVRRFSREIGEALDDLIDLSRADMTSKYAEKVRQGMRQIDLLVERIEELKEIDAKPAPLPKGLGTEIIERLGVEPGPGLGRIMKRLMQEVEDGALEPQMEYDYYIEFIERNRLIVEGDRIRRWR